MLFSSSLTLLTFVATIQLRNKRRKPEDQISLIPSSDSEDDLETRKKQPQTPIGSDVNIDTIWDEVSEDISTERSFISNSSEKNDDGEMIQSIMDKRDNSKDIEIEQNKKDDDGGEDGRNDSARPVVRGAALFNGDKMENVLPQDNVPALLMLCNDFNNGSLTAVLDDGTRVGVLLTKSKTKIKTSVKNGCPSFDISVDCVADCTETSKIMNEAFTPEVAENIKTALEKAVRRNIDDTVKKCFTEFNKDPFGFDKRVKRADAEYYRAESDNWKSVLQKAGYSVTVNAKLRRAGDENMVPSS